MFVLPTIRNMSWTSSTKHSVQYWSVSMLSEMRSRILHTSNLSASDLHLFGQMRRSNRLEFVKHS